LLHWKSCIAKYYKIRQPGEPHNPSQKMEKPEMKIMSGSWEKEMGQLEITHF
jgi:chorismate synthase